MSRLLLALAALAFAFPSAAAPVRHGRHPVAPPAVRDWSRVVAATPEGGFRMGNPAARVKVVEYGSLTCPHCAAFAREGTGPLVRNYVRTGKASWEFRNYILNGIDVAASLLARCAGTGGFFPMAETLYATQPQWIGRVSALSDDQKNQVKALPEGQRLLRVGELSGLIDVAGRFGVARPRARACLVDRAGLDRLGKMVEAASAMGVGGTPTFFINGVRADANTWATIEPLIRNAGG
jgi:protein-disulfide isomerase